MTKETSLKYSGIRADCYMTEQGIVITLRDPEEMRLAAHWAMNGGGVSFRFAMKQEDIADVGM